ncbi:MAG: 7,8-didemethyl-8-hydroxy-5-deazariboflavin synthase subunit CofH [Candidatus Thorarchaeota archaeon]
MFEIIDQANPKVKSILNKVIDSEELTKKDALELLKVTGKDFSALQVASDQICLEKTKNIVTFVINRNINFTNICHQGCLFCSFSVLKGSKEGFLVSIDELKEKIQGAHDKGCSEVCIQGGINPDLNFDYYLDILSSVKEIDNRIHIHAFSPQEVFYMSQLSKNSIENTLRMLKEAGLGSIPGTAAEILVDEIRKIICPKKITTDQWIDIISTAHEIGIPTTSTIMYGHIENLQQRVEHLDIIRNIQKETGGFTEFVPLPFVKKKPIQNRMENLTLRASYGMEDLKLFSVARLFFNNFIDNIQCSWVKLGPKFAQVSLNYGVNDFSGTLIEENISKSAGAEFGEYLSPKEIINIILKAGKKPAQRDTLYNILKYY